MDQPALIRRRDQKLQAFVRATSADRHWTGFDAKIYDVSGGFSSVPALAKHSVTMLVGRPVHTSCRVDDLASHRLQVPGEADVIPAGYGSVWEDGGPTTFMDLNVTPALVAQTADAMGISSDRIALEPRVHVRDPHVEHIAWAIKAELETELLGRVYAESLATALAAQLLRRYAPVSPKPVTSLLSKRRLRRILDYVHDHIADDLSLAQLAGLVGMSPSHFKVIFKESVGLPVHQYVIRSRVQFAIDLIAAGRIPLRDVALQAGFANQSHMARCVKRIAGITPGAARS